MQFSQLSSLLVISLAALSTAAPNAAPEAVAEANALETRTLFWNWFPNQHCECDCEQKSHWPRDLEARTFFWKFPSKNQCKSKCEKQCDGYFHDKEEACKKDAFWKFGECKKYCEKGKRNYYDNGCLKKCQYEFDVSSKWCNDRWHY